MYLQEEVSMLARVINQTLKEEEKLKDRLPMDPEDDDLFHVCSDGLVLIYFFNKIRPNMININKVYHGASNVFKTRNNLDMLLNACKTIIKVIAVDAQAFLDK